jgi:hypothetical protein
MPQDKQEDADITAASHQAAARGRCGPTARGARWEDELRAARENTARSGGAPLKEGAAVRGSRLEDSHRHNWHARAVSFSLAKGEFDNGGHESARESIKKMPHRKVQGRLITERQARTCFVRHPRNDINLS